MDKGNTADPYITCRLGHEVQGDKSDHCKATVDPYFGRCYEFHTTMPGPANLHIIMKDFGALSSELILALMFSLISSEFSHVSHVSLTFLFVSRRQAWS